MSNVEQLFSNTLRVLSVEAVQAANSGHPGMPMGCADIATVLFTRFLKHDPSCADWPDRDRFVLSCGHGSALLYSLLHLTGYDLPLDELKRFRQVGSKTPGHPEFGHTVGVEATTGPLGQGIANGVGMALAEEMLAARFNGGEKIVDHHTYVLMSDGCMMEGISHEAASLAGHLKLGKLIALYDDNGITIEGKTNLAFSEDVARRFEAYGWKTERIDGHDFGQIAGALERARADRSAPHLILCRTKIGKGSPNMEGSHKTHGAPLGAEEVAAIKKALGWADTAAFHVPEEVKTFTREKRALWTKARQDWEKRVAAYLKKNPELNALWRMSINGELPAEFDRAIPDIDEALATRASSGKVINAIAPVVKNLIGGSADLAPSNNTEMKNEAHVGPGNFAGRNLHFGVREHAMGALMNGIALHGGFIPYGGTFLVFADYMRPSVRLAALMGLRVVYVFTHDSVYVGEDGPTHQPVEHVAALRVIPNLTVIRPADARETAEAWRCALERRNGPTALILTRQNLPTVAPVRPPVGKGAYRAYGAEKPELVLLATGSEVSLAIDTAKELEAAGKKPSVVSMPSMELFDAQDAAYKKSVLPADVPVVSIEAQTTFGWDRYTGAKGFSIGIETFGESGNLKDMPKRFGMTKEAVMAKLRSAGLA